MLRFPNEERSITSPNTRPFTHPFRAAVEADSIERALDLLHPSVEFRSPAVHTPTVGEAATGRILRAVFDLFDGFHYVDELTAENRHVLVFRAKVGDREVEGIDYLTTNDDGLITEFVVMIRPLSGLLALTEAMKARLADPRTDDDRA